MVLAEIWTWHMPKDHSSRHDSSNRGNRWRASRTPSIALCLTLYMDMGETPATTMCMTIQKVIHPAKILIFLDKICRAKLALHGTEWPLLLVKHFWLLIVRLIIKFSICDYVLWSNPTRTQLDCLQMVWLSLSFLWTLDLKTVICLVLWFTAKK